VVALTPGLFDRFPWLRSMFLSGKEAPLLREIFLRNRRLNEQRLLLVRHVTPEECGYVPCAELPIVAHDVYIYKVPNITPIRVLPPEPAGNDKPHWNVTANHPVEARVQLAAGRYDVFINATKRFGDPHVPASLNVWTDDEAGCSVHILDVHHFDYFVSTIELDAPGDVRLRIDLGGAPSQTADGSIWVNSIVLAPTTGDVILGNPISATGLWENRDDAAR